MTFWSRCTRSGFAEIGDLHRLAGAKLTARLHADRAVAGGGISADFGLRAALDHDVGGFQDFAALDIARQHRGLDGLDGGAGEAQLGRRRAVFVGDLEGDVEAAVARIVAHGSRLHAAGVGGIEPDIAGIAIEGQAEIGGIAKAVAALQRARDLLLRCPCPRCVRASRVTEISFRSLVSTPIT